MVPANITGNMESTFQYLVADSIIDAKQPVEKGLLNTYMNVFYTQGNFKAGLRFESYLPRIQGYPSTFDGTGIGMRYVGYANDFIDVTLGSFYEQFGSGLALRIYEDRNLGYDNLLDGAKVHIRPYKGIVVKGVYGYQRYSFTEGRIQYSDGIVRGFDGEINLNQTFAQLSDKKLDITLGGSFVSKYQPDDNEDFILPENVGCYGFRGKLRYDKFTLDGEYVIKEQDPSQDNQFIYNYGHAAVINAGYSKKGLGVVLSAKSVDNMSYRSDRNKQLQNVLINYLPAMNKTHSYNLVASLYPYATQPVGEIAYQAEVLYTIKKGSKLGGKYGTSINANYSTAYQPLKHKSGINPADSSGVTYRTSLFDMSDSLYWRDFNINIYRKFSKNFNLTLAYYNLTLNNDVASVTKNAHGLIKSNIFVVETGLKFKNKQSMRIELQGLFVGKREIVETIDLATLEPISVTTDFPFYSKKGTPVDKGNWATLLVEYTFNSHWFASIMDQWNMPNDNLNAVYHVEESDSYISKFRPEKNGVHHLYFSAGYINGATRITAGYGRQRAGLFCVGGVCRPVPASNGLTLNITHSF